MKCFGGWEKRRNWFLNAQVCCYLRREVFLSILLTQWKTYVSQNSITVRWLQQNPRFLLLWQWQPQCLTMQIGCTNLRYGVPKIQDFPHKSLEVAPVTRSGGGIILCCVLSDVGSLVPSRAKGSNLLPYWVQGYDVGCTYPCGCRVDTIIMRLGIMDTCKLLYHTFWVDTITKNKSC